MGLDEKKVCRIAHALISASSVISCVAHSDLFPTLLQCMYMSNLEHCKENTLK